MGQQHQFQFIIDGTTYKGVVKNWRALFPSISPHETYKARLSTFNLDKLEFVEDAAEYIDAQFEAKGMSASTTVTIRRLNETTLVYEDYITNSQLDYGQYERDEDASVTLIGVIPGDFVNRWLQNDQVTMELQTLEDLAGNTVTAFTDETHTVTLHSQVIVRSHIAEAQEGENDTDTNRPILKYYQLTPEDNIVDNGLKFRNFNLPAAWNLNQPTSNYLMQEDGDLILSFSGTTTVAIGDLDAYTCDAPTAKFIVVKNGGTEAVLHTASFATTGSGGPVSSRSTIKVDMSTISDYTFSGLVEGDRISMYWKFEVDGSDPPTDTSVSTFDIDTSVDYFILTMSQETTYKTTPCEVMPVWEYFLRIIQKLTGRNDPLRSSFYGRTDGEVYQYPSDGEGSLRMITTGKLIRQFPLASNPVMSDFLTAFQILNEKDNIAVGVETINDVQYIVIEKMEYFHGTGSPLMTITEPSRYRSMPALDYLYGNIRCGNTRYEKLDEGTLNSPHTQRELTTPIYRQTNNTYDIQSPGVASGFLIELMRRDEYAGDQSKDTQYDDDLFMIDCSRSGSDFVPKTNGDFSSVNNINNPDTQYNLALTSVRRIKERHGIMIWPSALGEAVASRVIRFQSGKGNTALSSTKTGESAVAEDGDLVFSAPADDPLWDGRMIEVQYPLENSILKSLLSNPNQTVTLDYRGTVTECFIDSLRMEDMDTKETTLNLLPVYTP